MCIGVSVRVWYVCVCVCVCRTNIPVEDGVSDEDVVEALEIGVLIALKEWRVAVGANHVPL